MVIGLLIYLVLPWPLQLIVLLTNSALPDPIPLLDEIIMFASFFKKFINTCRVVIWILENKIIFILGLIGVILLCLWIF